MITFQLEPWSVYYSDPARPGLWLEHYQALTPAHDGQMAMDPDVAVYEALDRAGMLVILTARDGGTLVGYCLVVCKRHLHYSAVCGFEDSYYLTPSARRGTAGIRLISEMLKQLKARGVRRSYWMTKEFASIAALFERLGMKKMDSVYCHSAWETD